MNPTNIKFAVGATLTGLLMIAAGGLTGISSVAADGPDVQHPGELSASVAPANVAANPADLTVAVVGQTGATAHVYDCTLGAQSDQIINPTVSCVATAFGDVRTNVDNDAMRLIGFSNAPTVDGVPAANGGAQDGAAISMDAIQAVSASR